MLYAILAYHVEADVMSWTKKEDESVMSNLQKVHERLNQEGRLGPAARLGVTGRARRQTEPSSTARSQRPRSSYLVLDCADDDAAVEATRELRRANPSAFYEIRPIALYLPGQPIPRTEVADVTRPREV